MADSKNLVTFTDANFEAEVLKADKPVVVDFWATWCAPCRHIAPLVDELATSYAGKVKVGKLDVDGNQAVASRYGVRSIPTILLFKEGKVVEQVIGANPAEVKRLMEKAGA